MGRQPYSDDLRSRVVAAVAEGLFTARRCEAVCGERVVVDPVVELHAETGSVSRRRRGRTSRSPAGAACGVVVGPGRPGIGPDPGGDRGAAVGGSPGAHQRTAQSIGSSSGTE
jgi:hypothetical protein